MTDNNSRQKIQTYGNNHQILKRFYKKVISLDSLEEVEKVGIGHYKKVKWKNNKSKIIGFDNLTNSYLIKLKKGKLIQRIFVTIKEDYCIKRSKRNIESVINPHQNFKNYFPN